MTGEGAASGPAIEIARMSQSDLPSILGALSDTFGPTMDASWFDWKHRAGPWGQSDGWIAFDEDGLVGVRLFLPWRFTSKSAEYVARRPCDTVTVPRARGRGVFRALTEHAIWELNGRVDFLFNTPNDQSMPGYLRMGFTEWDRITNLVSLVRPNPARLTDSVEVPRSSSMLRTELSPEFLAWRYFSCPVHDYSAFSLQESDDPNGLIFRIAIRQRLRVLVVAELWGGRSDRRGLVRAAAARVGSRLVWTRDGEDIGSFVSLTRGATAVTRLDLRVEAPPESRLSMGDLESVL